MDSSYGTPSRASATGNLRGRPRTPFYQHEHASRSTTDLSNTMMYASPHGDMPFPPIATASPRLRPFTKHGQRCSLVRTGSLQDLSSTSFEQRRRATLDSPTQRPSRELKTTELMRRFLLHNLMFTYGIDPAHFRNYLQNTRCELLSMAEQTYMASLGQDLRILYDRVRNNRYSLLGPEECVSIVEEIVIPAQTLHIEPGYLCEHLMSLPDHGFEKDNREKAHIFSKIAKKSFWRSARKWDTMDARTHLAKCLVSDDCVVESIAPSRHVQVLIGTCIESFSKRHCKKGINMGSVIRKIHVTEHTERMMDAVITRAQPPVQSPQRRSSIPIFAHHRSAIPSQLSGIAKDSILSEVNEID